MLALNKQDSGRKRRQVTPLLGHFEDKMKIGNRIKVTGGYDIKNKNVKKQG